MTDKKIHQTHFPVGELPWKKEIEMNKRIKLGRLHIDIGWFSGDPFCLFQIKALEIDHKYYDFITVLRVQIAKLLVDINIAEGDR